MDFLENIKMATKTLALNKLRSGLTMLGIIIGNASVIFLVGIGQGIQNFTSEQFESLGSNVLFVVPGSRQARQTTFDLPKTLVLADAEAIKKQVPTIIDVAPQINSRGILNYRNQNMDTLIMGVTPSFLTVRSFNAEKGRFLNEVDLNRNKKVAVIGSDIVERLFNNQNPIGQQMRINNLSFEIIGVMESKGSFLGTNQDESVFIPLTTMANQVVGKTSPYGIEISFISISAKDEKNIGAAKFQIENLLRLRHKIKDQDDFGVQTQKDILQIVGTITGVLTLFLGIIAAISLLVGGIGVMNIMLVSVIERTQEIGLRKAIGARKIDILSQFLIEAIILCSLGGFLGTMTGIGGLLLIGITTTLTPPVSPIIIIVSVGISGGIGLLSGVFPAIQAAKLDPIVALRSA
jgi:putative ABC transport system permease protein